MILDYPLLGLIKNCETLCEAACCGRDAFDFSPIHIASFLIRYSGKINSTDLDRIRVQLHELDKEADRLSAEGGRTAIEAMNQYFTAQELSALSAAIHDGFAKASLLVEMVEKAESASEHPG